MEPTSLVSTRPYRVLASLVVAAVAVALLTSCAGSGDAAAPAAAAPPSVDLSQSPWARQPDGSPSVHGVPAEASLAFPPGTTYAQALSALAVSARQNGGAPAGATLQTPLPAEVVYVAPDTPEAGIRLSLTAPWGWDLATGAIRPPSFSLPGSLSPAEVERRIAAARASGAALPEGAVIDVPALPECQIAHGTPEARIPCA